jgi:ribosomal protein S20
MTPGKKTLSAAFKALDKSAKGHIIHKNKAARLKSRLSKLLKK